MAVRYSGNTVVRLKWTGRGYRGTVADDYLLFPARVPPVWRDPTSPEAYDRAATMMLRRAEEWTRAERTKKRFVVDRDLYGQPKVSRVFQAPCPTRRYS